MPRAPAIGLPLRGIWHRRALSILILIVASAAAAAAAMGVSYAEAGATAVLRQELREAPAPGRQLQLTEAGWPDSPTPDAVLRDRADALLETAGGSGFFDPPIAGVQLVDQLHAEMGQPGQFRMVARDGICAYVSIISGGCPTAAGDVLVSAAAAEELAWELGDTVLLESFGNDEPTTGAFTPVPLTIVGTYRVLDSGEDYWAGRGAEYFPPQPGREFAPRDAQPRYDALLVTAETFDLARPLDVGSVGSGYVTLAINLDTVEGRDTGRLLATVAEVRLRIAEQRVLGVAGFDGLRTEIAHVVSDARDVQSAFLAPSLLVTLQVVALTWVLLFIVVTSVVEARASEISLARLRGLSWWAVHRFALGEATVLIAIAVPVGLIVAPVAAQRLASELGPGISTGISMLGVLAAGSAALGGLAAAVLAAGRVVSRTVAEQWRQSTTATRRRSWLLDAVVLAIAAAGFAELATGGLLGGGSEHSTVTLLAPGLLALAGAVLAARLLPLAARSLLAVTRRRGGVGAFLAVRRVARTTGAATTLVVLVTSLGLVTFAAAAWSSARANHREVALTHLGADTVLTVTPADSSSLIEAVNRIDPDGDEAVVVLTRQPDADGAQAALVGVDPQRFARVAYWRADFAAEPLADLLSSITAPAAPAVVVAGDHFRVSYALREVPDGLYFNVFAEFEVPDSTMLRRVHLGELRTGPPVVSDVPIAGCTAGCELRGLAVQVAGQEPGSNPGLSEVEVAITEIAVRQDDRWLGVDVGLTEAGRWRADDSSGNGNVWPTPEGLLLRFPPTEYMRASPNTYPEPMPALTTGGTSPDPSGAPVVGLDDQRLTIIPTSRVRALPGVSTVGALVDYDLAERAAVGISADADYEVWCAPGSAGRIRTELEAAGIPVTGEQTAAELARRFGAEGPGLALRLLVAAGAAAALLATGATAIELYASSRRRSYEIAALQAVGLSRRSLRSAHIVEHAAVFATAAVVGPAAGLVASWVVVSKVPTFSVPPETPPLRYPLDLSTISLTAGAALAVAAFAVVAMTAAIQHAVSADQLREAST